MRGFLLADHKTVERNRIDTGGERVAIFTHAKDEVNAPMDALPRGFACLPRFSALLAG